MSKPLSEITTSTERRATMLGFQPPSIGEEEIAAVAETLRSGWLTTGPRSAELERRMAEYLDAEHVLALASGTAALHLSLVALGVGPGDEVVTSPITWPATANVIVHTGATPVFVDVRDDDLNIDPARVADAVNERTKVVLPVDLAGQPADLDPLLALGIPIVEDAAHAAESVYRGRKIGSIAHATCFSLYATKNIAAGEGGLIATNDARGRPGRARFTAHAQGRRLALRHPGSRIQGESLRRARVDRALPARQGRGARGDPATPVRPVRRGRGRACRGHASRARPARRTRAAPLRRPHRRRVGGRDARRVPACARGGEHRDVDSLPPGAPAELLPRAVPDQQELPVAERAGSEVLSLPLSPAHSDADIGDVIAALRRVHERFTR